MDDGNGKKMELPNEDEQRIVFAKLHHELSAEERKEFYESLHPREAMVINCLFGLEGLPPKSFDETSSTLEISRERIRQVLTKLISRIRHTARSQMLRDYLDQ